MHWYVQGDRVLGQHPGQRLQHVEARTGQDLVHLGRDHLAADLPDTRRVTAPRVTIQHGMKTKIKNKKEKVF